MATIRPGQSFLPQQYPDPRVQPSPSEKPSLAAFIHPLKANNRAITEIKVKKGFLSKVGNKISFAFKNLMGAHLDSAKDAKAKERITAAMAAEIHKTSAETIEERIVDHNIILKNLNEAKQYLEEAKQDLDYQWEIELKIAKEHYTEGEYKEALKHLNKIPLNSFNLDMFYFKAVLLKDSGDYLAAHRLYELLIGGKRFPENISRTDLEKEQAEMVEIWAAAKPEKSIEELQIMVDYFPANKALLAQAYLKEGEKHYYSDVKKAYGLFQSAAKLGHEKGKEWTERCFMHGLITTTPNDALNWYQWGAKHGSYQADCSLLLYCANMYRSTGYPITEYDVTLARKLMKVKDPDFKFSDNHIVRQKQIINELSSYRQSQTEKAEKIKSEIAADLKITLPPCNVDIEKQDYFNLNEIPNACFNTDSDAYRTLIARMKQTTNLEATLNAKTVSRPSEEWKWNLALAKEYERLGNHGKALDALMLIPASKFSPELHYIKANLLWRAGWLEDASKEYDLVKSQVKTNSPLARRMIPEQDLVAKKIEKRDLFFTTERQRIEKEQMDLIKELDIKQMALIKELEMDFGIKIYGKEKWETNIGDVGVVPPLPPDIGRILESFLEYFPGKTVAENTILCLIPATVNGKVLDPEELSMLVRNPKRGKAISIVSFGGLLGPGEVQPWVIPIKDSHWVLMTKDIIPGSLGAGYGPQKNLVMAQPGYDAPTIMEAAVCRSMEHVVTGKIESFSNTHCKDLIEGHPTRVTGFLQGSFEIDNSPSFAKDIGMAAVRRLN